MKVSGIDKYIPHWWGGNVIREIFNQETCWIYELRAFTSHSLNVEWAINCFINNKLLSGVYFFALPGVTFFTLLGVYMDNNIQIFHH